MVSASHVAASKNQSHHPSGKALLGLGAIALGIAGLAFWIWQAGGPARAAIELQRRAEIAAESQVLCEKWGHPAGTQKHAACISDLKTIREQHEKRIMADAD